MLILTAGVAVAQTAPKANVVPFVLAEDSGIRPIVAISVDGLPLRAVVHANASSYLQLNHQQAHDAKLTGITHKDEYGISKPGAVSSLGRDRGTAKVLTVGVDTDSDVPVDIFEKYSPDGQDIPMLGLKWIGTHKIVMDFAADQIFIDPSSAIVVQTADKLLKAGYSRHKLYVDPSDGRYVVHVNVGSVAGMMVVGTVAKTTLDKEFASRGAIQATATGTFGGPSGATGTVAETIDPVVLSLDATRTVPLRFHVEDEYAYMKAARPSDTSLVRVGTLGTDFLTANKAVIDFGSGILYLK